MCEFVISDNCTIGECILEDYSAYKKCEDDNGVKDENEEKNQKHSLFKGPLLYFSAIQILIIVLFFGTKSCLKPLMDKSRKSYILSNIIRKRVKCLPLHKNNRIGKAIIDDQKVEGHIFIERHTNKDDGLDDTGDESTEQDHPMCSICYENFKKDDEIAFSRNHACQHAFHVDCIVKWLMKHSDCPTCRANYVSEEV